MVMQIFGRHQEVMQCMWSNKSLRRMIFMIPASVFHSIVPCVAITSSEEYMATENQAHIHST